MHARSRKPLQDTLTFIHLNRPLAQCGYALEANAERHLRTRLRIRRTISERGNCGNAEGGVALHVRAQGIAVRIPEELVPAGETPGSYLRKQVIEGALRRWPNGMDADTIGLIYKELALVAKLGYEKYFLTVYDIVSFARNRKILCQGRGSATNSIICYCLLITELDPVRMDLLIDCFILQARNEPARHRRRFRASAARGSHPVHLI